MQRYGKEKSNPVTFHFGSFTAKGLTDLLERIKSDESYRNQIDHKALRQSVQKECDRLIAQMDVARKDGSLTYEQVRTNIDRMGLMINIEKTVTYDPAFEQDKLDFCSRPVDTTRFTRVGSAVSLHLTDASKVGLDVYA